MNGIHDLGGMQGFGPIEREENEPVFHADWERRIFALLNLTIAAGQYHVDEIRHSIERMAPAEYLTTPYYVHWLHAAEDLLDKKGVVTHAELERRMAELATQVMPALPKDMVATAIKSGASTRAQVTTAPRFKAGDKVVARNINPPTHTRLPRYIRGKHGVVQHNHGGFAFADTRAHGLGDQPHHVYSVRFEARELWGDDAEPRDAVYIDLWEPYIEPAA